MRDIIFISHATPEDNEFTIWLASRLELMGYKVWIDKNELLGGEVFWQDIENAITKSAVKFLLVYSKNICYPSDPKQIKGGIQKEIDYAAAVVQNNPQLKDFFTILRIDDSPYDLFPGSKDLNQIPFTNNWAEGLGVLSKKFIKDEVPQLKDIVSSNAAEWYLEHYLIKNPIIHRKELYYTNWWTVENMPSAFFILRFANEKQASTVHSNNPTVLLVRSANCLVSFTENLDFDHQTERDTFSIEPTEIFEIKISDLINGYNSELFPTHRDAENHFKKLFKRALHNYLKSKQLMWYELANNNLAYYHTNASLPSSKVDFTYPFSEKKKKKQLFGKYLTVGKWHYGLSVRVVLHPFIGFKIKTHIVFSENGSKAIEDKGLQHAYRRKKGKRMFNEEWRDLLIAFITSLKNPDGVIELPTNTESKLIMKEMVEMYWSEYGYLDPKDLERQSIFAANDGEEDQDIE